MRITRIRLGALASLCAAGVAAGLSTGCGGGGDDFSDTAAGRAAEAYVDAYNGRDFDRVCTLLSESYKRERELVPGSAEEPEEEGELETGCAEYFKEHTAGAATTLTLLDVQQNGVVANAHVRSESQDTPGGEAEETISLARQPNGTWKVTDIAGYTAAASS